MAAPIEVNGENMLREYYLLMVGPSVEKTFFDVIKRFVFSNDDSRWDHILEEVAKKQPPGQAIPFGPMNFMKAVTSALVESFRSFLDRASTEEKKSILGKEDIIDVRIALNRLCTTFCSA